MGKLSKVMTWKYFQLFLFISICNGLYVPVNFENDRVSKRSPSINLNMNVPKNSKVNLCDYKLQEIITGNNLLFSYERYGYKHYFFNASHATDNKEMRDIYEFISDPESEHLVKIRTAEGKFLYVENEILIVSDTHNSTFVAVPIEDSRTQFNLKLYPSNEDIVTPCSAPPFTFYLRTRYPDEPASIFELAEQTVIMNYSDKRENINRTIEFIRQSHLLYKPLAYSQLLKLMQDNNHIEGSEIFTLAHFIHQDLGVSSQAYQDLPEVVKLLTSGTGTNISWSMEIPMKYNWASREHEFIMPYTFTRHPDTGLWAITYSNQTQLYANINGDLQEHISETKEFIFQIRLEIVSAAYAYIELFTYHSNTFSDILFHPIVGKKHVAGDDGKEYYFESREVFVGNVNAAGFVIQAYVNLETSVQK